MLNVGALLSRLAGEYISERAAMHRLDYTEGKTEEELEQLSAEIRAYQV